MFFYLKKDSLPWEAGMDDKKSDDEWQTVWEQWGAGQEGLMRSRRCAWSALDKRRAATPHYIDHAWRLVDATAVVWLPLPWAMMMFDGVWGAEGMDLLRGGGAWTTALLNSALFGVLFYALIYLTWRTSKASWRARWAGPSECAQAKTYAARNKLAELWLGQARGRGIRCADVEMMIWMVEQESRVGYQRSQQLGKALREDEEAAAFREINENHLGSLQERDAIEGQTMAKPDKKSKGNRL
jgi:hypothetical protein